MAPKKCYTYQNAKFVVKFRIFGKQKPNFAIGSTILKVNRAFRKGYRKVSQKCIHAHYCPDGHSGINDWNFVIFEQCKTHAQLKQRENFRQHSFKTFYPIGINELEEYLY